MGPSVVSHKPDARAVSGIRFLIDAAPWAFVSPQCLFAVVGSGQDRVGTISRMQPAQGLNRAKPRIEVTVHYSGEVVRQIPKKDYYALQAITVIEAVIHESGAHNE